MAQDYVRRGSIAFMSGACVAAIAIAQPALAQDAQPLAAGNAEEATDQKVIIVTAQKRAEDVQDVPIAITALNTDELAATGISGTEDLRVAVPALNVTTAVGGFGLPRIRGIGATGQGPGIENPVAVYVDGVYYSASFGVLQSLFDTEQVAVLKGPQGTLFGRNATGGLIQIKTLDPQFTPTAKAQVGYGNYDTVSTAAFVSMPLSNTIAFSVSGQYQNQQDGYGKNIFTGNDVRKGKTYAGRAKLLVEPSDETSILFAVDGNGRDSADPAFVPFTRNTQGLNVPDYIESLGGDREQDIYADTDPRLRARQWGASLSIDQDVGFATLKSITAYRRTKLRTLFDPDGTTVPFIVIDNRQSDKQFTQELNLISKGSGPFQWVMGAFYMHDEAGQLPFSQTTGLFVFGNNGYSRDVSTVKLDSYSAFAEGTYDIGPDTSVIAGFRYTHDKRTLDARTIEYNANIPGATPEEVFATTDSVSFSEPSWRLSIDHKFSPDLLVYASYNHGFRSGTFVPQGDPIIVLEPEKVDAFEVGFKSDLFDRRLRLNVAAYYYDQSSVQVFQIISGVQLVYNADGAEIYGVDADFSLEVTDRFRVFGGVNYTSATYSDFPDAIISTPYPLPDGFTIPAGQVCQGTFGNPYAQVGGNCLLVGDATGNQLQNTPKFTASLGGAYELPTSIGSFTLAGNFYHNDGFVGDSDGRIVQPAYELVGASLTWRDKTDTVYAKLWGSNLTDSFYRTQLGASNSGDNGTAGPPRTYGLTLGFEY